MTYLNDQILKNLKEARKRRGLSQRALSSKSGVPQSHISKIENGGVDLRVSSLIALARVLDLELELVPRKSIPAVKSIVRQGMNTELLETQRRLKKQFSKFNEVMAKVSKLSAAVNLSSEMTSINRLTDQIERLQPNFEALAKITATTKALEKAFNQDAGVGQALRKTEEQFRQIRNLAAHTPFPPPLTLPAYGLDEVDDE